MAARGRRERVGRRRRDHDLSRAIRGRALQAGFERSTGPAPLPAATSALARLMFTIN